MKPLRDLIPKDIRQLSGSAALLVMAIPMLLFGIVLALLSEGFRWAGEAFIKEGERVKQSVTYFVEGETDE